MKNNQMPSSFRDPSSFVYTSNGEIFREINQNYKQEFYHLMESGLYEVLSEKKMLVKHSIISETNDHITIKPDKIPFVSYPYEWTFEQIKDAALLTLKIQHEALKYNMTLKDASIYNVQFLECKPIFIDTTSFVFNNGQPWKAYFQFCKHFLYPLWLLKYVSQDLNSLYISNLDGLEPKLVKNILPFYSYFNLSVLLYLIIPTIFFKKTNKSEPSNLSLSKHKRLIRHLYLAIKGLKLNTQKSTWNQYYDVEVTNPEYLQNKEQTISNFTKKITLGVVLDIGANNGHFSYLLDNSEYIISTDFDKLVVNSNYINLKNSCRKNILPLILDICNPSPAIGWNNVERASFFSRAKFDSIIALAVIHHMVFSQNISLQMIAKKLSEVRCFLIIEFVPIFDDKVQQITRNRDISHIEYSETLFEGYFGKYFEIIEKQKIFPSERIIYLYERKN